MDQMKPGKCFLDFWTGSRTLTYLTKFGIRIKICSLLLQIDRVLSLLVARPVSLVPQLNALGQSLDSIEKSTLSNGGTKTKVKFREIRNNFNRFNFDN